MLAETATQGQVNNHLHALYTCKVCSCSLGEGPRVAVGVHVHAHGPHAGHVALGAGRPCRSGLHLQLERGCLLHLCLLHVHQGGLHAKVNFSARARAIAAGPFMSGQPNQANLTCSKGLCLTSTKTQMPSQLHQDTQTRQSVISDMHM